MMRRSDAATVRWFEALCKKHQWRHVALVGAWNDGAVQTFLANCLRVKVTVVASWRDPAVMTPSERLRQDAAQGRMRRHAKAYAHRLTLIESEPLAAMEALPPTAFDAVILLDGVQPHLLPHAGQIAAPLIKSGGYLVGLGHRDPDVRGILDSAIGRDRWVAWREGVWGVQVERDEPVAEPAKRRGRPKKITEPAAA